jgi:hypothetical protein
MSKVKNIILAIIFFAININAQDNKLFTDILTAHVDDGLVDYKNLSSNNKLNQYLEQLSAADPNDFTKHEKLAFWINAYNAFTLKIIIDNYPVESITDLHTGGKVIGFLLGKTVWDKEFITINDAGYSLNYIEHDILRKMGEPRIHFAIVCASISCPQLLNEAFEANKIESQLDKQTKLFINDSMRNSFNLKNREAHISKIFDWFDEDFGDSDENVLKFIADYLPAELKIDITNNIDDWDVLYKDYNWGLNEIK